MDANTMPQAVICEVCGSYFETRRGLSSHARLHLRQLGVTMSESSRGPIDLLYQIVRERDGGLPNRQTSSPVQPALATSEDSDRKDSRALTVPDDRGPSKESAAKAKPLWAPQESDAPLTLASSSSDEFHVCQLCGAWYETRKGLSSHARFHLRRFGLSDSKTSPIEHLYKVMVTRHIKPVSKEQQKPLKVSPKTCAKRPSVESPTSTPLQPPPSKRAKAPDKFVCMLCGEEFDNRTGLSSHSRSHLRHMGVNDLLGKSSAIDAVEELVSSGVIAELWTHKTSPGTSSGPAQTLSQAPTSAQSSPLLSQSHSPTKANFNHSPLLPAHRAPKAKKGFRLAVDPQNKKPKQEPIEVEMHSPPLGHSSSSNSPTRRFSTSTIYSQSPDAGGPTRDSKGRKGSASPLDFSLKEKSSPSKSGSSQPADRCCELCGFEFENRKALASHSRAHLRQLGVTEWKADGSKGSPIEFLNAWIRKEPTKVAEITQRYRMGDLYIRKKPAPSPSVSTEANCVPGSSLKPLVLHPGHRVDREGLGVAVGSSKAIKEPLKGERGLVACSDVTVHPPRGFHPSKHLVPTGEDSQDGSSQQQPRPKNIPALLPKPPLTPLVKLVGKYYSLKCRFCEEVFHGPVSIQVDWIAHLQKHILMLGYKGKASLCPTSVSTPTLIDPVAV